MRGTQMFTFGRYGPFPSHVVAIPPDYSPNHLSTSYLSGAIFGK